MESKNEHVSEDVKTVEQVLYVQLMNEPINLRKISQAVVAALSIQTKKTKK